ncbi:hypothetical protein FGO68_gene9866 [Halteria grandinella]|uniref:Glycerophosphocholine acyltransferase 1 n=1 Tax=Halteria grandinella TaxID=5974 RepID=A0A8J8NDL0_HALGN|nr:hypothetical protein FGO68_gene9866 [Halteria grandinella]
MLGHLDLDQLDKVLSKADNLAMRLAAQTSLQMPLLNSIINKKDRDQLRAKFHKRKQLLQRYLKSANAVRLQDKLSFVMGVFLLIFTTYVLGRYPNDFWYIYHCLVVISLVAYRFYNYRQKGWHYYLFDFCYFANILIMIFLNFTPKNDILFKVFFVYANGPFGLAIPAFKNSMIFHKLDNLISVTIHLVPMVSSWNLRWHTLQEEATKDTRYFLTLSPETESFTTYLTRLFLIPLSLYLLWAFLYSLKVFVISSKRIKDRNYETMYIYYMNQPWAAKILLNTPLGPRAAPFIFMTFHVTFFVVSSVFAGMAYFSFTVHSVMMMTWIGLSVWNGANFYMEYFSRKYESGLKALEEVELTFSKDEAKKDK